MKTLFSKYQLVRKSDQISQLGALIKLIDNENNWGVADICPWPHLGDLDLVSEISKKGPLYQRAEILAHKDLQARKSRQKLISETAIQNNILITDYQRTEATENLENETVKIKADHQFELLLPLLNKLNSSTLRLDFNSKLRAEQFSKLIPMLPKNIEYIEDPCVWDLSLWKNWNQYVPLAVDFATDDPFLHLDAWTYLIIKPSRQDADVLIQKCLQHKKFFTLTSAMDHPVGFAHGFHYAQRYAQNLSGFSTLDLYEENEFSHYFTSEKNKVSPNVNADYGIGMSAALNKLHWVPK